MCFPDGECAPYLAVGAGVRLGGAGNGDIDPVAVTGRRPVLLAVSRGWGNLSEPEGKSD